MGKVKIRNVKLGDHEAFVSIYQNAYKGFEQYAYTKIKDIRWYFRWLMRRNSSGFFVAEVDDKRIGFVACDVNWYSEYEGKQVAEIHELFIAKKWQGKGIGSLLLKKALEYGISKQRDVAELWVGVTNYKAIKFYKKHGFTAKEVAWGKWLRMTKKLLKN